MTLMSTCPSPPIPPVLSRLPWLCTRRQREAELQKRLKAANKKDRGEVSESAKVREREAALQAKLAALENTNSESRTVRSPWLSGAWLCSRATQHAACGANPISRAAIPCAHVALFPQHT